MADRVRTGHGRGERRVGQPERVAGPLHFGQLLPERLVLVQEHVQLRRMVIVRDGRRRAAVRRRQQRTVRTGQLVTVVVVTLIAAATVRPTSGRQRVQYGSLGGRGRPVRPTDRWRGR